MSDDGYYYYPSTPPWCSRPTTPDRSSQAATTPGSNSSATTRTGINPKCLTLEPIEQILVKLHNHTTDIKQWRNNYVADIRNLLKTTAPKALGGRYKKLWHDWAGVRSFVDGTCVTLERMGSTYGPLSEDEARRFGDLERRVVQAKRSLDIEPERHPAFTDFNLAALRPGVGR